MSQLTCKKPISVAACISCWMILCLFSSNLSPHKSMTGTGISAGRWLQLWQVFRPFVKRVVAGCEGQAKAAI